jgi:hypothetical protein
MKEKFTNAMVTCSAIAVFFGGSASIINGLSSIIDSRVNSVLVARQQASDAAIAADDSGVVGAMVNGTKKIIKSLN